MSWKSLALVLGLIALAGCHAPVRRAVDGLICERAAQPVDVRADVPAAAAPPTAPLGKPGMTLEERLEVPLGVPGARAPEILLPSGQAAPALERGIEKQSTSLPTLGPEPAAVLGPAGTPLSLADLQRLAKTSSPLLRQAAADVEAANGAAVQAGLYPNPTVGTATNTMGPGGGPMFGVATTLTIKTMGKLKLARSAALMDVVNTELAYRKAETDVMAQVRAGYFAALVARTSMRAHQALVQLTDELYRIMLAQRKGGVVAVYEPLQVGVLAEQARASLLTARNSYQLAWRQLAAAVGQPALPLTELAGQAEMPVPRFDYRKALAVVLANHTDMLTTTSGVKKARYLLRLAEVAAYPDPTLAAVVQQDSTPTFFGTPQPNHIISVVQMTMPVPVFDLNQGNIRQAQGALVRAVEEPHRVRAELAARFAEAFRRYDESRALLELYRGDLLPKQVHAFRAAVARHYGEGAENVAFTDLIQSEQNLVATVGMYLTLLGAQWQAVVDVASFLQTDDLFQLAEGTYPVAVPELEQLLQLPCCHPCAPQPALGFSAENVNWAPSALTLGQPVVPANRTARD
jgi:outer membrane protein, heavy metal efflux system